MIRLFAYGTLKRGFLNGFYLQGARYLGEFTTDPAYSMYSFGTYPAVSEIGKTAIKGEVYKISEGSWRRLIDSNGTRIFISV